MSNITNLNRDYLIKINVKEATIDVPKMTFWNTDKKTSNMFVQLVINMSENELIKNYATIENATDYKIVLNVIKPKTNQYRTFEAKLLNEEKALFEIDLTSEFIDQVGNYNFEFEVSSKVENNDESITTSSSTYEVKGSILTNLNQEISSSPDLPILKQLIEQVKSLQGGDLTGYQKKSDNSLETTSKEVVGAINEVNSQFKDIANKKIDDITLDNNVLTLLANSKTIKTITLPSTGESGAGSSEKEGWRLINEITLTEDVESIDITKDKNGNPFELTELLFVNCINYSKSAQSIISINYSANLSSTNNFLENKNKYIIDKIKLYKDIGLIERESISSVQTQFIYGQYAYTSYRVENTDIESIQSIKFLKYDGTYLTGSTIKLYGK